MQKKRIVLVLAALLSVGLLVEVAHVRAEGKNKKSDEASEPEKKQEKGHEKKSKKGEGKEKKAGGKENAAEANAKENVTASGGKKAGGKEIAAESNVKENSTVKGGKENFTASGNTATGGTVKPNATANIGKEPPEDRPKFETNHPRQTEVLKRTDSERSKIEQDYKDGKITQSQYDLLKGEVKEMRKEDFTDAKANGTIPGGYITKGQKKVMNKQENAIDKQIQQDESGGANPQTKSVTEPKGDARPAATTEKK